MRNFFSHAMNGIVLLLGLSMMTTAVQAAKPTPGKNLLSPDNHILTASPNNTAVVMAWESFMPRKCSKHRKAATDG